MHLPFYVEQDIKQLFQTRMADPLLGTITIGADAAEERHEETFEYAPSN